MKSSDSIAKRLQQNNTEFVFRRFCSNRTPFPSLVPHHQDTHPARPSSTPQTHSLQTLSSGLSKFPHVEGRTNASLPLPHPICLSLLPHFDSGMRISILAPPSIPANHHPLSLLPPSCSLTPYRCPPDKRNPRNMSAQGCVNLPI